MSGSFFPLSAVRVFFVLHSLSISQLLELRYDQIHDELIHKGMGLEMGLMREDDCFLDKGKFRDLWVSGDHDDFGFGSIKEIFSRRSISNLLLGQVVTGIGKNNKKRFFIGRFDDFFLYEIVLEGPNELAVVS